MKLKAKSRYFMGHLKEHYALWWTWWSKADFDEVELPQTSPKGHVDSAPGYSG
jgi:hypothetical protein